MRLYAPIAKIDADQRLVWGYASTEALDGQGEIVKQEAVREALAAYMRFANIREMHQASAVGIAEAAEIDDRGLYVAARIVDDRAWDKVRQGVYKGFSIGGRVTSRDAADPKSILGLDLTEISLVDRPANPETVFDCWKAEAPPPAREMPAHEAPANDALARRSDPARFQRLHDMAVSLGAACHGTPLHMAEKAAAAQASLETELAKRDDALAAASAALAALADKVEALSRRPDPPRLLAKAAAVAKEDDGAAAAALSEERLAAALSSLGEEERTLLLIKAARMRPIHLPL